MKKNTRIVVYALGLSIASAYIIFDGAAAEPYLSFRASDAFIQIGLAISLIVLWLQFASWLFYAAVTRRVPKPWLVFTIWIGIAMFYLSESPLGYVGDITKFVIEKQ
jgi:hypothetical protein